MDVAVCHVNADFDSVGALVGAGRLYPGAALVLPQGALPATHEFLSLHQDLLIFRTPADIQPETITRLVVVDLCTRERLGPAAAWLDLPGVEVHVYDHHADEAPELRPTLARLERWGSASAIVATELRRRGETPDPVEATAMLLGIYEDTGRLTYSATTPEDLEAAAWLLRQGAELSVVERFARHPLTEAQRRLQHELLATLEGLEVRGARVAVAAVAPGPYVDDASTLAETLLDAEEADAAFMILPMEGATYVVARSRSAAVDAAGVAREFGGGGHARAASARVPGEDAGAVRTKLLAVLPAHVAPEPTARQLMSRPVRSVAPDTPISEARRLMVRYGHSGLVVMDDGGLMGIVTRRDVDRARHHRLEHAPVSSVMTRAVRTVGPETPLSEIEHRMVREAIGRLPVIAEGQVLGIVTRTDVLRALHGARYLRHTGRAPEGDLPTLLRERIPARLQRALTEVGEAARGLDAEAFAVGGFVRDLLLGVRNLDVDILVEPDGVSLARAVARAAGGQVKGQPRFGTAKATLPDGLELDFATARTESYAQPGALPEVEQSTISDDLRRRDFTVNALALSLRPETFGELRDPFQGRADLEQRRLRVLHNLSFIEDPTRVFRAARFESRFRFRMEPHTEALARGAIRDGALGTLTPERLRAELFRCCDEARAVGILLRLEELGVFSWLTPELHLDRKLLQGVPGALEWLDRQRGSTTPAAEAPLAFAAAVLAPLGEAGAELAGARFRLAPAEVKRVLEAIRAARDWEALLAPGSPSEVTARLRGLPEEAVVLLRARAQGSPAAPWLERFVTSWRDTTLEITGDDLKALGYPPGPRLGQALRGVLAARLDGRVRGRSAELALARETLGPPPTEGVQVRNAD
jgi:tRNA nucleotidyltransferase (CCA-adding enzyme)